MSMQELQERKSALEAEKGRLKPDVVDDQWRAKVIDQELAAIEDQLKEAERQEKQAAVLATFALPQDYDAITGIVGMNDEILNLINQVADQLADLHSQELTGIHEEHKTAVEQIQADVSELVNRNAELQKQVNLLSESNLTLNEALLQERMERSDAELKRNNAVALLEEEKAETAKLARENESLKSQINELEGMLRTFRKPTQGIGGLQLTSTLKVDSEEERKTKLERQRLDVINRNLTEKFGLEPLRTPEPEVTEKQLEDAFRGVAEGAEVVRDNTGGIGVQEAAAAVEPAADEKAGVTLEQRVKSLEIIAHEMVAWKLKVNEQLAGFDR